MHLPGELTKKVKKKINEDLSWIFVDDAPKNTLEECIAALTAHEKEREAADSILESFKRAFHEEAYQKLVDSLKYAGQEAPDPRQLKADLHYKTSRKFELTYEREINITAQTNVVKLPVS